MNLVPHPVQIITRHLNLPNSDIFYPAIVGLPNATIQQKMNNDILSLVNRLIASQGYYNNPSAQLTGWYELKNNQRNVLSLNIGNYAYAPMAAHGLTVIKSLTFDVTDGIKYSLGELFKPGSNYVQRISDIIKVQIKQRDITLLDEFNSIKPDQDYYIADKVLVVYFQLYELTAYAYGFPMFPISVYEIQDIIEENSPLSKMAEND